MPNIDHDKISDIIRGVAAEKIVPRFRQLAEGDIRTKSGPTDLVTIADEEAEIELTRILTDLYPGTHVLGEEAVSSGRATRDILNADAPVWIVDPVDGTNNFAHGNPVFGTMVALISKGERVASWIYQIPRSRMVAAQKGGGVTIDAARFTPPMKPVQGADFQTMHAFISRKFMPPSIRPYVDDKITRVASATSHMCCAWDYVELMEGNAAFSIYKRIEPWDHMAGVLFLEECGFYVRKWDGEVYKGTDQSGGLINAATEDIWLRAYDMFLKEPLKNAS